MKKLLLGAAALALLAAGGGAAAWHVGAGRLLAAVEAEAKALEAQGLRLTLTDPKVGGFPFAFALDAGETTLAAVSGRWSWTAPSLRAEASLLDPSTVRAALPPESRLRLSAPGAPPLDFAVTAVELALEAGLAPGGAARLSARSLSLVHAGEAGLRRAEFGFSAPVATVAPGPDGRLDAALDTERASVITEIDEPTGGRSLSESTFERFSVRVAGRGFAAPDVAAFIAAGGEAEATVASTSVVARGSLTGAPEGDLSFAGKGGPSEGRIAIADGRVRYEVSGADALYDIDWRAIGGGKGAVSARRAAVSFEMPVRPTDAPAPYVLRLSIDGLAADEAVWAALDPGKALPRDPMVFNADIGGQARLLAEIGALAETGGPPVDVRTVDVADLSFSGLGARASATGALQLTPGAPAPNGSVSLRVEGWRTLVDRLEGVGLIDAEQAAFVALLAETYAKPGEAEGVIVSDIELLDGAVFANGRRVR